jgi:hypothetical protein
MDRELEWIHTERKRQDELKAAGRFKYTCADAEVSDLERYVILAEELGEVARCLNARARLSTHGEDASDAALRKELIQIAAISKAWLERL